MLKYSNSSQSRIGGLMRETKIPVQELGLKMGEGGGICVRGCVYGWDSTVCAYVYTTVLSGRLCAWSSSTFMK